MFVGTSTAHPLHTLLEFRSIDLSQARFRAGYFGDVQMRGVTLYNVDIHGDLENVTVNGVDIAPLVQAELDRDRAARPSLDEVLELRRDRMATMREVVGGLTDESLAANTEPVEGPGGRSRSTIRCPNAC